MEALRAFLRRHRDALIAADFRLALMVGAPAGYTLSGYSYKLELAGKPWGEFWRPRIDGLALAIFGASQADHCKNAFLRESTKTQGPT